MIFRCCKLIIVFGFILAIGIVLLVVFLNRNSNACYKVPDQPSFLSVYNALDDVVIHWAEPAVSLLGCNTTYLLYYSIGNGQKFEVTTANRMHTITTPPICSDVLAELWTIGETGLLTEEPLRANHTVLPPTISVTTLGVVRTDAGVIASWQKPAELESCDTSYLVQYSTEFGSTFDQTDDEEIMVPEDKFCFRVITSVSSVVGSSQTPYQYIGSWEAETTDLNVSISPENRYKLIATWSHPNHDLCSMEYTIGVIGQGGQTLIVSEPIVTLDISYCLPLLITIVPSALSGANIGPMVVIAATQDPDPGMIDVIEIDTITKRTDAVVVSWLPVSQITGCVISYQLEFITDLTNLSRFANEPTFELFREFYCFTVEVEIRGVTERVVGEPTKTIIQYDIEPVQNLELNPSTADNTMVATWSTNRWQEQCELEYLVTYQHGVITDSFVTKQTTAVFNLRYCTTTVVSVKTVFGNLESEEESSNYIAGNPPYLEEVENVKFSKINATTTIVSWNLPESLNHCVDLYTVIATNEDGIQGTCQGTEECEITLNDDICPFSEFTISPTSLPGAEVVLIYPCT